MRPVKGFGERERSTFPQALARPLTADGARDDTAYGMIRAEALKWICVALPVHSAGRCLRRRLPLFPPRAWVSHDPGVGLSA